MKRLKIFLLLRKRIFFDEAINEADEMLINDYSFDEISQSSVMLKLLKTLK